MVMEVVMVVVEWHAMNECMNELCTPCASPGSGGSARIVSWRGSVMQEGVSGRKAMERRWQI